MHRDGVVSCEGPGASRCGSCYADGAEDCYPQDEEHQGKASSWRAHDHVEDVRETLALWCVQYVGKGWESRTYGDDEEQSGYAGDWYTEGKRPREILG